MFLYALFRKTFQYSDKGVVKLMKTVFAGILAIIVVIFIIMYINVPYIDRFNPFIKMETHYAKVPTKTQDYEDITIYDKDGDKLGYTLTFNGFDPSHAYVKVTHKGRYVKSITYIDKSQFPEQAR